MSNPPSLSPPSSSAATTSIKLDAVRLPRLSAGKRHALNQPPGAADALWLAAQAQASATDHTCVVVVCAQAQDAYRLQAEVAWFAPELRIAVLPDWETLPYEAFSPHQDLISERLATLWQLLQGRLDVLLLNPTSALQRLPPPAFLHAYTFDFKTGDALDEAALKAQLVRGGYHHVQLVMAPGEFAVRGGLIDLYPMGAALPLRVDLLGAEIDSIRVFDPDSQRSLYPVKNVRLLPGREFPMDEASREAFRRRWREHVEGDPSKSPIYKDIGNGIASAGIEYYLPLFFDTTATLADYLPERAQLWLHGDVGEAFERFWHDLQERVRLVRATRGAGILPPQDLFLSAEDFFKLMRPLPQLALRPRATSLGSATTQAAPATPDSTAQVSDETVPLTQLATTTTTVSATSADVLPLPELQVDRRATDPLARLKAYLAAPSAHATPPRTLLLVESPGRRDALATLLSEYGLQAPEIKDWRVTLTSALTPKPDATATTTPTAPTLALCLAPLSSGFDWPAAGLRFITETELFALTPGARKRRKQEQASNIDALIRDLAELKAGDPIVHTEHGIGRYRGLVELQLDEHRGEFLHLEYAGGASLYVPVAQLHLVQRYTGVSAEEAPLHQLGSPAWDKARRKAQEQARDTAAELLNVYARRALHEGYRFRFRASEMERFAAGFGFEETADQLSAIAAVIQDMASPRPMDRLICGDVGFGKTEVALRAAFMAVMDGKQVAVLAPTTLLAEQHTDTFRDRFSEWPVNVAELSRFRSVREASVTLDGLAKGTVDIVIGTHKLLSAGVQFKRLGLVIVDEEHRFGVRHKEAIKALRSEVDVLTLTATPIPRTLGMALEGMRDLSVIATAPQRRLAIKTLVREESHGVIREAVLRELKRGGQVYFLHNEVATIEKRASLLAELLPEARIAIAHGQMPERQLEHVMREFVAQRHNLLVCSTIIETGIDVPSANTIVITRADLFGLAQLHQLRGRVGRSHHQAYAYMLVPEFASLPRNARQRLDAIASMEELGSGFYLAMHDLEIRGAGEVLGEAQSGNIIAVGYQLYADMLSHAVDALKAGREPDMSAPLAATTEVNLHAPALLPSDYVEDTHIRLSLYKRLASCSNEAQLENVAEDLVDRYGSLPEAALTLFDVHHLRLTARPLGIVKMDIAQEGALLQFGPHPNLDPSALVRLLQDGQGWRMQGKDKLRITKDLGERRDRVRLIRTTLTRLKPAAAAA